MIIPRNELLSKMSNIHAELLKINSTAAIGLLPLVKMIDEAWLDKAGSSPSICEICRLSFIFSYIELNISWSKKSRARLLRNIKSITSSMTMESSWRSERVRVGEGINPMELCIQQDPSKKTSKIFTAILLLTISNTYFDRRKSTKPPVDKYSCNLSTRKISGAVMVKVLLGANKFSKSTKDIFISNVNRLGIILGKEEKKPSLLSRADRLWKEEVYSFLSYVRVDSLTIFNTDFSSWVVREAAAGGEMRGTFTRTMSVLDKVFSVHKYGLGQLEDLSADAYRISGCIDVMSFSDSSARAKKTAGNNQGTNPPHAPEISSHIIQAAHIEGVVGARCHVTFMEKTFGPKGTSRMNPYCRELIYGSTIYSIYNIEFRLSVLENDWLRFSKGIYQSAFSGEIKATLNQKIYIMAGYARTTRFINDFIRRSVGDGCSLSARRGCVNKMVDARSIARILQVVITGICIEVYNLCGTDAAKNSVLLIRLTPAELITLLITTIESNDNPRLANCLRSGSIRDSITNILEELIGFFESDYKVSKILLDGMLTSVGDCFYNFERDRGLEGNILSAYFPLSRKAFVVLNKVGAPQINLNDDCLVSENSSFIISLL